MMVTCMNYILETLYYRPFATLIVVGYTENLTNHEF